MAAAGAGGAAEVQIAAGALRETGVQLSKEGMVHEKRSGILNDLR